MTRVALTLAPIITKLCEKLRNLHIVLLFSEHSVGDVDPDDMIILNDCLRWFCQDAPHHISIKIAVCLGKDCEGSLDEEMLARWLPDVKPFGVLELGRLEQIGITKVM